MANKMKKGRKPAARRIKFDAKQVLKLYKKGTAVADIAVACGYPRGHGQNRVRTALMKVGAYTPVRSIAAPVATGNGKTKLAGKAISTAEQFAREAYSVVENRYHKLVGRAREGFPELVMGYIAAGIGAKNTVKVAPVAVPSGMRLIRGGAGKVAA